MEKFPGSLLLCQYLCGFAGKICLCASCTGQNFRQKEVLTGGKGVRILGVHSDMSIQVEHAEGMMESHISFRSLDEIKRSSYFQESA